MLSFVVYKLYQIITLLMLIRILLSWFSVNWYKEPLASLKKFTDFFFDPFRKFIPPIGMLDISPIFAFIALGIIAKVLIAVCQSFGL